MALGYPLAVFVVICHIFAWIIAGASLVKALPTPNNCNFTVEKSSGEEDDDALSLNDMITIGLTIPGVLVTVVGILATVYKVTLKPNKTDDDDESQESVELMKGQDILRNKLEELQREFTEEKMRHREEKINELRNNKPDCQEKELIQTFFETASEVLAEHQQIIQLADQLRHIDGQNNSEYEEITERYTEDCEDVMKLKDLQIALKDHVTGKGTNDEFDVVTLVSEMTPLLASVYAINVSVNQRICEIGTQDESDTKICPQLKELKKRLDEQNQILSDNKKVIDDIEIALSREKLQNAQHSETVQKLLPQLEESKKRLDEQNQIITDNKKFSDNLQTSLSLERLQNAQHTETIQKLNSELKCLRKQLKPQLSITTKTNGDDHGEDSLEPQERTHGETVMELHRCLRLIHIITTEIVRECYHDTRLGEFIQVLAKSAFGRQESQQPIAAVEGDKPVLGELLATTVNCAYTIFMTLSEGLKWQSSDSFFAPNPLHIQGMFQLGEGLAVFTTMNADRNSIGIIPIESTFDKSPHCIQLSTQHWKGTFPVDIASTDDLILVVCEGKRYIYEFPCQDSDQPSKVIKVIPHDNQPATLCISTNKAYDTVIVGIAYGKITSGVVIMSLPDFTQKYVFDYRNRGVPRGFDFTNESTYYNCLVYTKRTVAIETDEFEHVAEIQTRMGYEIMCAIFGQSNQKVSDIFVACKSQNGGTDALFRYIWNESQKIFTPARTIVDNMNMHGMRCVRRTSVGGIAIIKSSREVAFYQSV